MGCVFERSRKIMGFGQTVYLIKKMDKLWIRKYKRLGKRRKIMGLRQTEEEKK